MKSVYHTSLINMNSTDTAKLNQMLYEHQSWLRVVDFFEEENVYLKKRLAEVVYNNTNKDFLALAERYQNLFIIKTNFMQELRHDINEQEDIIKKALLQPQQYLTSDFFNQHLKLQHDTGFLEKDFAKIRNEFNKYITQV